MLPEGFERLNQHRGAVGIEIVDALRGRPICLPIDVQVEQPVRARVDARSVRGAVLFYGQHIQPAAPPAQAVLRIIDSSRRFVPRRIQVHVVDVPSDEPVRRIRPVHLFPGAAWPFSAPGATGIRGRVSTAAGDPVRWSRIEARIDGQIVGLAHGDDRGEFLLLLWPLAGELADPGVEIQARVGVFMQDPAPPTAAWIDDYLGDLPIEAIDLPNGNPTPLAEGIGRPPTYAHAPAVSRFYQFEVGRVRSKGALFVV